MSNKSIFMYVNDLEPGMVIGKEIYSENILLVAKNVIVTESIIFKLKEKLFFDKVEVYSNDKGEAGHVHFNNEKSIEDIQGSFEVLSKNVEGIFDNLEGNYVLGMQEVRAFAKKIQGELDSTGAIIKNIVLHGSGKDSIYKHSVNVAALSSILGSWLELDEYKKNLLTYSAILHDYGKVKIDKKILNKVETLTKEEFQGIKKHPIWGYEDIKKIENLDSIVSHGILMHHERLDGTGYPFGIKAEQIPLFARIIAIADVFDAVNSDRIYKRSKSPLEVLEIIQKESLGKLDYEYCKVFLDHIINYYMGQEVSLNDGQVCKIVQIDINDLSRPLLLGEFGFIDLKKEKGLFVEELVI
ncbi:MAG: HD-GYP domain-containing protein [Clostridiaceae bacterium]|nr:HD-GYP domain-containing protein [Clostridiaceae bacterium]